MSKENIEQEIERKAREMAKDMAQEMAFDKMQDMMARAVYAYIALREGMDITTIIKKYGGDVVHNEAFQRECKRRECPSNGSMTKMNLR